MNFIGGQSIVVFLGNTGMGENFGKASPKVLDFDVYYEDAAVAGFGVQYNEPPVEDLGVLVYYENNPPSESSEEPSLEDFEVTYEGP